MLKIFKCIKCENKIDIEEELICKNCKEVYTKKKWNY